MLEACFDLLVPLVMADIVNVGIAAGDARYILTRCALLLLLAMVGLGCSVTAQYFSAKAAVGYATALRHALFAHIQSLGFSEMDTIGTSTLITRMTSDHQPGAGRAEHVPCGCFCAAPLWWWAPWSAPLPSTPGRR